MRRLLALDSYRLGWIVIVLGAALRVLALVQGRFPPELWFNDAAVYRDMVAGLLSGRLTSDAWIWTPGYALCALPFAAVLGPGGGLIAASLVLGLAAPIAVLVASRKSGDATRGAIAAMALALLPEMVLASTRPLADGAGASLYVLSILGVEAVRRTRGLRVVIAAGLVAGLAALTRSELALGLGLLGLLPLRRPSRRRIAASSAFLLAAALVLAPFVFALRSASGTWSLSLKPQYNLILQAVYERGDTYLDKRQAWNEYRPHLQTADGEWDARRIAGSVLPGGVWAEMSRPDAWTDNLVRGLGRTRWELVAFLAVGLIGLGFLARRDPPAALTALVSLVPFVVVPAFFQPVGRLLLPLAPAAAWGFAALVERVLQASARGGARRRLVPAALLAAGIAISAHGTIAALPSYDPEPAVEVELLLRGGRTDRSLDVTRAWIGAFPEDGRAHLAHAEALDRAGNRAGALAAVKRALGLGADRMDVARWYLARGMAPQAEAVLGDDPRGQELLAP